MVRNSIRTVASALLFLALSVAHCRAKSFFELASPVSRAKTKGVCGEDNIIFLKFHKVGSTTVANVFETIAERYNMRLCARGPLLMSSVPCQVWNTHDTEIVFVERGFLGFQDIAPDAIRVTLLRNPMDRILSRFFYDHARLGIPAPRDIEAFKEWFEENEAAEGIHYYPTLSRGQGFKIAEANIAQFDVVGVSDLFDEFMTLVMIKTGCSVKDVTFKSEKVVVGRPTAAELPLHADFIRRRTLFDTLLYRNARRRMIRDMVDLGDEFKVAFRKFAGVQKSVNQGCEYSEMDSSVNTGKDCYDLALQ